MPFIVVADPTKYETIEEAKKHAKDLLGVFGNGAEVVVAEVVAGLRSAVSEVIVKEVDSAGVEVATETKRPIEEKAAAEEAARVEEAKRREEEAKRIEEERLAKEAEAAAAEEVAARVAEGEERPTPREPSPR